MFTHLRYIVPSYFAETPKHFSLGRNVYEPKVIMSSNFAEIPKHFSLGINVYAPTLIVPSKLAETPKHFSLGRNVGSSKVGCSLDFKRNTQTFLTRDKCRFTLDGYSMG